MIDVGVFNLSSAQNETPLPSAYAKHEQEKWYSYEQYVLEAEHSSFVPVIFSTAGGHRKAAVTLYSRIAGKLYEKHC